MLVQVYWWFFMLPIFSVLSPWAVATFGIGTNASGYSAELVRAAIQGVDRGQYEASIALNFHDAPHHAAARDSRHAAVLGQPADRFALRRSSSLSPSPSSPPPPSWPLTPPATTFCSSRWHCLAITSSRAPSSASFVRGLERRVSVASCGRRWHEDLGLVLTSGRHSRIFIAARSSRFKLRCWASRSRWCWVWYSC
ncbi:hypothetical protein NKJ40_29210 [Mesorhizobium sp. M0119]|uniref:hypothetical protein n=1 Tax=Mesorhizobium sp. M0119 TaxID=2956885 RepID=UPI0033392F36